MKKKLQKYLSGEREGFSLVELIIVIAIMAILIGIIALAVLPYLERSRESKDKQTLDTVYGAFQTALSEEEAAKAAITKAGTGGTNFSALDKTNLPKEVKEQVEKNLGSTIEDAEKKLVSQNATDGKFAFTYVPPTSTNPSGEITVTIGNPPVKDGDGNDFKSSSKADSTTSSSGSGE